MNNSSIKMISEEDYSLDSKEAIIHGIFIVLAILVNIAVTVRLYLKHRHHLEPIHVFEISFLVDFILALIVGPLNLIVTGRLSFSSAALCYWTNLINWALG